MKKAKVILSAVALFAVVGGALAFKAYRTPATFYRNTTTTTLGGELTTVCTQAFLTAYTTLPNARITITNTLSPVPVQAVCPTTTLYIIE